MYYNTATKVVATSDYEQTQPEETKPTPEYTDLQVNYMIYNLCLKVLRFHQVEKL